MQRIELKNKLTPQILNANNISNILHDHTIKETITNNNRITLFKIDSISILPHKSVAIR